MKYNYEWYWLIDVGMRPPSAPSAGLGKEGEEGLKMRLQAARGGSAGPGIHSSILYMVMCPSSGTLSKLQTFAC